MIHLASILLAYADQPQAHALHGRLMRNSYDGPLVHSVTHALAEAKRLQPDIVLIGPYLADGSGTDLAQALKGDSLAADIPLFLLTEHLSDDSYRDVLGNGIDDVMMMPADEGTLFARMRPLVRLATMRAELHSRVVIARGLGMTMTEQLSLTDDSTPETVLALGDPGDIDALRDAMGTAIEIVHVANLYEIEHVVAERHFDAAVLFTTGSLYPYLDLCVQIRNKPRLFNLPVMLVMDAEADIERSLPYRQGVSRLLYRPVRSLVMQAALKPLVRRQRLRWAMRNVLVSTLRPVSQDPLSDVYSRDFLDLYLADRTALARKQDRHLSLILFYIPSLPGLRSVFGEAAAGHLLRTLSQWINGLLRAEDLCARTGEHEFCVVLPDTPLNEAQVVMHRIAGVLTHTDFAIPDVYEVVQIWLQVGATELGVDDTPETLVARARMRLE
ncbi:MAG: response regulator [Rhodospirillaceae bacterium]|nr:MAG: response regulator [Rhodospirillaceae bacterium]